MENRPSTKPEATFEVFGVTLQRPTHETLVSAAFRGLVLVLVFSLFVKLEDGVSTAGYWGAFFMTTLLSDAGARPMESWAHCKLVFGAAIVGNMLAGLLYALCSSALVN